MLDMDEDLDFADDFSIAIVPLVGDDRVVDASAWVGIDAIDVVWTRSWLEQRLTEAGRTTTGEPVFHLRENRSRFSWGADAAQVHYVLEVAEFVFTELAAYGVGRLAEGLVQQVRSRRAQDFALPMDEADAEYRARLRLATRYDTSAEDLVLKSASTEGRRVSITLAEPVGGTQYEITFEDRGAGVSVVRCKRTVL